MKAANAALNRCLQGGYKVTVSVVDASGLEKVMLRGDGANPATISGAYRKAFTSGSIGLSSANVANLVATNPGSIGLPKLDDRIIALGGGLPILANSQLVGGIGVSGSPSAAFDQTCAQAGIDSLR